MNKTKARKDKTMEASEAETACSLVLLHIDDIQYADAE